MPTLCDPVNARLRLCANDSDATIVQTYVRSLNTSFISPFSWATELIAANSASLTEPINIKGV
jgi:hypothetical protein